jgi:molybdenum cofactor synthesis domain-containing protein
MWVRMSSVVHLQMCRLTCLRHSAHFSCITNNTRSAAAAASAAAATVRATAATHCQWYNRGSSRALMSSSSQVNVRQYSHPAKAAALIIGMCFMSSSLYWFLLTLAVYQPAASTSLLPPPLSQHCHSHSHSHCHSLMFSFLSRFLLRIGNEVLSGKVQDYNTFVLAETLRDCGVDLVRTVTVPDDVPDIAATARTLSDRVGPDGFVFTSGGIGPTHDDVTYEAIAKAFDRPLAIHKPTHTLMSRYYADVNAERAAKNDPAPPLNPNSAGNLKMVTLPSPAEYISCKGLWVPIVRVDNTYMLPGIPWLFTRMLDTLRPRLEKMGQVKFRIELHTQSGESVLAPHLVDICDELPDIEIGSYPRVDSTQDYMTKVTYEARNADLVREAVNRSLQRFSGEIVFSNISDS